MSVKWGVMGTASIATKVGAAIDRASNAELLAVASRSQDRAKGWAKDHGVGRSYGSYDALLEDSEIDAIYIPLPPSMHCEWTIKSAEAGKHVLCEKPLTLDTDETLAMIDACKKNGVQLMDGVMWVHHDWPKKAKAILDSGGIGELRKVVSSFSFNWGSEVPVGNIRAQKNLGGGGLGDLGYYCVRAILWAFDELPESVVARARYLNDVDVEMSGMLFFSGDRTASFDCGYTTSSRARLEVAGAEGSLRVDPFIIPQSEEGSSFSIVTSPHDQEHHKTGLCVQEVNMIERFSHIVTSGTLDPKWTNDALGTVRVCCALADSAESGHEVAV